MLALRIITNALKHERKHTEKLLNGLFPFMSAEIGFAERRILAKIEDIDASLGLIARELSRRGNGPPLGGTGS